MSKQQHLSAKEYRAWAAGDAGLPGAEGAKAKREAPEQTLQQAVAEFLDAALPRDAWWTAIGHGGGGKVRGGILKSMGVKPGVPDLLVIWRGACFFIELKSKNGRLSAAQMQVAKDLQYAGAHFGWARTVENVASLLTAWNVPLRASVTGKR